MTNARRTVALTAAGAWLLLALLLGLVWQAGQARQTDWNQALEHYLLNHLRVTLEDSLATGLRLDQMETAQSVIEREKSAFDAILAIDVFDAATGTVLYSTDADLRGQPAPEFWLQRTGQNGTTRDGWQRVLTGQRQAGLRFDNDLGQAAGGVVVTFSTMTPPATLVQWRALALTTARWLLAGGLASLAAAGLVGVGLRRLLRSGSELAGVLQGAETAGSNRLTLLAQARHQDWAARRERLEAARRELEAIDAGL